MSMSRITAYMIANNEDIRLEAGGPAENGKYAGWIMLGEASRWRPLLNTKPIYDTAKDAEKAMAQVVVYVRKFVKEELNGKDPIDHIMGEGPEAEAVKSVISMSKKNTGN